MVLFNDNLLLLPKEYSLVDFKLTKKNIHLKHSPPPFCRIDYSKFLQVVQIIWHKLCALDDFIKYSVTATLRLQLMIGYIINQTEKCFFARQTQTVDTGWFKFDYVCACLWFFWCISLHHFQASLKSQPFHQVVIEYDILIK